MSRGWLTESDVEDIALAWLEARGWQVAYGPDIARDKLAADRTDYGKALQLPSETF